MTDNGWMPKNARFPKAWKYYDLIVAGWAAVLTVLNALLPITHGQTALWISAGISLVAANLIWLRRRAKTLGILNHGNHTQSDEAMKNALDAAHKKPDDDDTPKTVQPPPPD